MSSPIPNPNLIYDPMQEQHEPDGNLKEGDEEDEGSGSDEEGDEASDSEEEADCRFPGFKKGTPREEIIYRRPKERFYDPKLFARRICLMSIESINLTIKPNPNNGDTPRRSLNICGKITVSARLGKLIALYHRKQDQPEVITEGEPYDLTLCGPKHSMSDVQTEYLYVRLYETGSHPLLVDDFYFVDQCNGSLICDADRAVLTVTFAESPPGTDGDQWTVYGKVIIIQKSQSLERNYTLFKRLEGKGIPVSAGKLISLDRSLVVAPFRREIEGKLSEASLTIEVNLCFVELGKDVKQLNGRASYVFTVSEDMRKKYPIREAILLKRKHPGLDEGSRVPDSLNIEVFPIYDYFNSMSELDDEESDKNFVMSITQSDEEAQPI